LRNHLCKGNRKHDISTAPTKARSREPAITHRRLYKTKSIGSGSDQESQAGRQSDGYGGWCLEFRREVGMGEDYDSHSDFIKDDASAL